MPLQVLGATLQPQVLWIVGITFVALLAIWLFFEKTTLGIAMRACAENRLGASLMGISTQKAALFSWAWGAGIGALAGMAVSPLLFMQYTSGVMPMVKGFIAMSIGGLASVAGAVVAGYLLGIVEAYTIGLVSSQFSDPIVFTILIVVLLFKPNGLFGRPMEQGRMSRLSRFWWVLVLLFIAFYPPTLGGMSPYRCGILIFVGIYIILAVSLDLLMGYAGQISVGHAAFFAIGAYVSGILTAKYGVSPFLP